MHQSISSANIPPGSPQGFPPIFGLGPGDLYHLNCPGVGPTYIITVLSCQLMPHEGTFQLQTDLPLSSLQNLFQSWGKTLSMVLKLKLEGMIIE